MKGDYSTFGSGGGYIKQHHSSQEGVDYNSFMDGARKLRQDSSGPFVAQEGMGALPTRRQAAMEPSTFSRATSALRRGVTICLGRSGPTITSTLLAPRRGLRTRRLGPRSGSYGGRGCIARWLDVVDASCGEQHYVAALCAATVVVARCRSACRQERRGAVAWHWDSPASGCKEDLGVIWVTVIFYDHI